MRRAQQRRKGADHGEAGEHAQRLDQRDQRGNRLQEIAQMAQQHDRQGHMENPAEQPDPLVGLEQALEQASTSRSIRKATPPLVNGAGVVGIFNGAGVVA